MVTPRKARASDEEILLLTDSSSNASITTETRTDSLISLPSDWAPNGWESLNDIQYDFETTSDDTFFSLSSTASFENAPSADTTPDLDLRPSSEDSDASEWEVTHDPLVEATNMMKEYF